MNFRFSKAITRNIYIYINYEYLSIHPTSNPDINSRLIEYIAVEHLFASKQIYENNKQNTYSKN